MKRNIVTGVVIIFAFFISGCRSLSNLDYISRSPEESSRYFQREKGYFYRGDKIEIRFHLGGVETQTRFNMTITIPPEGPIHLSQPVSLENEPKLPRMLTIHPQRKNNSHIFTRDSILKTIYREFHEAFEQLEVSIDIVEYGSIPVFVGGEVNSSGMLLINSNVTLSQLILQAGSINDRGDPDYVVLAQSRIDPQGNVVRRFYRVNLTNVYGGYDEHEFGDPYLWPGDIVYVPKKWVSHVNLLIEQWIVRNIPGFFTTFTALGLAGA